MDRVDITIDQEVYEEVSEYLDTGDRYQISNFIEEAIFKYIEELKKDEEQGMMLVGNPIFGVENLNKEKDNAR